MADSLFGKDLITLGELSPAQITRITKLAIRLKKRRGEGARMLAGKKVVLYFEKPSLRTRVSFEMAIVELGGTPIYMNADTTHANRGEPIKDTARVVSRYVDAVIYRAIRHSDVIELANYASVPVINALSEFSHPCQGLADYLTIIEKKGKKKGRVKLAYVGDGNNIAHSLLYICSKMGIDITVACPKGYEPAPEVMKSALAAIALSGSKVRIMQRPADAVKGADVVYTDVWVSMGHESEARKRRRDFKGFIVNAGLMALAAPDAVFMHDLPAHRGEEVSDEVIEGPQSIVFDQSENRLHAQKAVLALILGNAETKN